MQQKFSPTKGNPILFSFTLIYLKTSFLVKHWSGVSIEFNPLPLLVNAPILYLLETPENQRLFQGV